MSLVAGLLAGQRRALAKSITLIESQNREHQRQAAHLLDTVLAERRKAADDLKPRSFRIGLAGPPGAGKSSLIEVLGMDLCDAGHQVAVLAIDPSSVRTRGSILGDKTRMGELSRHENAFVRPSPSSGVLGGVAQHTADIALLCEAAGYDTILIETVGVGQSEVIIDDAVDMVTLVLPPASGDSLQGVKKGIVEIADFVLINKADGDLAASAKHTAVDYRSALSLLRPRYPSWEPPVQMCSALKHDRIDEAWTTMQQFREKALESGDFQAKRRRQFNQWLTNNIDEMLRELVRSHPQAQEKHEELQDALIAGHLSARHAARDVVEAFLGRKILS